MSYTWVEPFAGAAAVAIRLVCGPGLLPPVAWMGGKRRYARAIADAMGVPEGRPERVVLVDAGPWGWVWQILLDPFRAELVGDVLRSWAGEHPRDLWGRLVSVPPPDDLYERAAQWLWLQARSASGVPIWWDGWKHTTSGRSDPQSLWGRFGENNAGRWKASNDPVPAGQKALGDWQQADHGTGRAQRATQTGGDWQQGSAEGRSPQPAGQRGTWRMGEERKKSKRGDRTISQTGTSKPGKTGGMVHPCTIAARIDALAQAFACVDLDVFHEDVFALCPFGPSFVYLDPPYAGATGYGWDCPRDDVVALAEAWEVAGAVVAVSEAEPLDISGWHHLELTRPGGKPEWLTLSREPVRRPERQGSLFA